MKTFNDHWGRSVVLTEDRLAHVMEHPEMSNLGPEIEAVLERPSLVRRSRTDPMVELFYRYYENTAVGGKWLCAVVKYRETDAFIITAYLTDKPKTGENLWPTN